MKYFAMMLFSAGALSACNKGPSVVVTNASQAEVAQKVAAAGVAASLSPGRWEGTLTIHDIQMAGMDPKIAASMKQSMGRPEKIVSCLTPEEAKSPHFFGKDDKQCRYDHFIMSDGKIDAVATCARQEGVTALSIKGTYSSDSYHVDTSANGTGSHAMKMAMTMDAKRVGQCKGTEDDEG